MIRPLQGILIMRNSGGRGASVSCRVWNATCGYQLHMKRTILRSSFMNIYRPGNSFDKEPQTHNLLYDLLQQKPVAVGTVSGIGRTDRNTIAVTLAKGFIDNRVTEAV